MTAIAVLRAARITLDNLLKYRVVFDDADLPEAGALRAEWRAEEAAWSRAALERWEHDRSLADVLRDCMHRGDTVAVDLGSLTYAGAVASVGTDIVRVATADGAVDLRLAADAPLVLRVVASARRGGSRGDTSVSSFAARLRQLDGTRVQLGLRVPQCMLEGDLLVGRDQVSVQDRDGRRAYVPTESVGWVRPVDVD